jgi:hypothetical protein
VSSPASSFGTRQWFDGRPRHRRPEKCCGKKGPVMTRGGTHRSIARIVSCAAAGRESVLRFPIFRSNTPTKPRVKGEALAEARRRSGLSIRAVMVCCWAQGGLFTRASPSVTRRAALQAQPFSTCICSRIICASSTVYRMSSSRPSPQLPDRPPIVAGNLHSRGPRQSDSRSAARTFRSTCCA